MIPTSLLLVLAAQEHPDLSQLLRELAPPPLEEVIANLPPGRTLEEILAGSPTKEQAKAEEARAATDRVSLEVAELRADGRYEDAYDRVFQHREWLEASGVDSGLPRSVDIQLQVLESILGVPEDGRAEYQRADRMTLEVFRLNAKGSWPEARALQMQELALSMKLFGRDSDEVATAAYNLALLSDLCGDHASELPLCTLALVLRRQLYGEDHSIIADTLHQLGFALTKLGRFPEAERCLLTALERSIEEFGLRSEAVYPPLNSLAILYLWTGSRDPARLLFEKNLELLENLDLEKLATTHDNLAALLRDSFGDFEETEKHQREALEIRRRVFGDRDHNAVAVSLANLAASLGYRGDFDEAEALTREAMAMKERVWGSDHPEAAREHGQLGDLLLDRGDLAGAERHVRRAVELLAKGGPGWENDLALHQMNLGVILLRAGRTDEARAAVEDARKLYLRLYGEHHAEVARCTGNLAAVALAQGKQAEAEALSRSALAIERELLGPNHGYVATEEERLGDIGLSAGRLDEARVHLEEAQRIVGVVYGEGNPRSARLLGKLASVAWSQDRKPEALDLWQRAFAVADERRNRIVGGDLEHALYARQLGHRELAREFAWALLDAGRSVESFAAIERGRDRVLADLLARSESDLVAQLTARSPEAGARLKDRLDKAQAAIGRESSLAERIRVETALGKAADAAQIAILQAEFAQARVSRSEAEAAVFVELRSVWPDARPLSAEEALAALEPGEFLLSYVWSPRGVGGVLVPAKGAGMPESFVVVSGEGSVESLRASIEEQRKLWAAGEPDASASALGTALLPARILERLKPAKRIVVIPDGPLNGVAFEGLPVSEGRLLLDWNAEIVYASSASLLAERRRVARAHSSTGAPTLLMVANPDARPAAPAEAAERERALPGSAIEASQVASLFEAAGGSARMLTGADASLAAVEGAAGARAYLHFACHGTLGSGDDAYASGLTLSDGTLDLERLLRTWKGRISGAELVVLSACETQLAVGLGDADVSLPWGFFFAGVPSVVATQWKVDDTATALLMSRFYENLLGQHGDVRRVGERAFESGGKLPMATALHEAKLWLRAQSPQANRVRLQELGLEGSSLRGGEDRPPGPGASPRSRTADEVWDFSHPRYWAAFVLFGAGV